MKRVIALLLIAGLCLSLAACGSKQTVDITLDNWQDYFEIKWGVEEFKNSFDEIENIYLANTFYLKEEFQKRLVDVDVAIEFVESNVLPYSFEYNAETGEIQVTKLTVAQVGEEIYKSVTGYPSDEGTTAFRKGDVDKGELFHTGVLSTSGFKNAFEVNENIIKGTRILYTDTEITRIQGTITLK